MPFGIFKPKPEGSDETDSQLPHPEQIDGLIGDIVELSNNLDSLDENLSHNLPLNNLLHIILKPGTSWDLSRILNKEQVKVAFEALKKISEFLATSEETSNPEYYQIFDSIMKARGIIDSLFIRSLRSKNQH